MVLLFRGQTTATQCSFGTSGLSTKSFLYVRFSSTKKLALSYFITSHKQSALLTYRHHPHEFSVILVQQQRYRLLLVQFSSYLYFVRVETCAIPQHIQHIVTVFSPTSNRTSESGFCGWLCIRVNVFLDFFCFICFCFSLIYTHVHKTSFVCDNQFCFFS